MVPSKRKKVSMTLRGVSEVSDMTVRAQSAVRSRVYSYQVRGLELLTVDITSGMYWQRTPSLRALYYLPQA
jgi:hypothetical protein